MIAIVRLTFLYYIHNLPKSRMFTDEVCSNNERQHMANLWMRILDMNFLHAMELMWVYVIHAFVFLGFDHVTFCFHYQMVVRQTKIRLICIK